MEGLTWKLLDQQKSFKVLNSATYVVWDGLGWHEPVQKIAIWPSHINNSFNAFNSECSPRYLHNFQTKLSSTCISVVWLNVLTDHGLTQKIYFGLLSFCMLLCGLCPSCMIQCLMYFLIWPFHSVNTELIFFHMIMISENLGGISFGLFILLYV